MSDLKKWATAVKDKSLAAESNKAWNEHKRLHREATEASAKAHAENTPEAHAHAVNAIRAMNTHWDSARKPGLLGKRALAEGHARVEGMASAHATHLNAASKRGGMDKIASGSGSGAERAAAEAGARAHEASSKAFGQSANADPVHEHEKAAAEAHTKAAAAYRSIGEAGRAQTHESNARMHEGRAAEALAKKEAAPPPEPIKGGVGALGKVRPPKTDVEGLVRTAHAASEKAFGAGGGKLNAEHEKAAEEAHRSAYITLAARGQAEKAAYHQKQAEMHANRHYEAKAAGKAETSKPPEPPKPEPKPEPKPAKFGLSDMERKAVSATKEAKEKSAMIRIGVGSVSTSKHLDAADAHLKAHAANLEAADGSPKVHSKDTLKRAADSHLGEAKMHTAHAQAAKAYALSRDAEETKNAKDHKEAEKAHRAAAKAFDGVEEYAWKTPGASYLARDAKVNKLTHEGRADKHVTSAAEYEAKATPPSSETFEKSQKEARRSTSEAMTHLPMGNKEKSAKAAEAHAKAAEAHGRAADEARKLAGSGGVSKEKAEGYEKSAKVHEKLKGEHERMADEYKRDEQGRFASK